MKGNLLQNQMVQSLVAAILCAALTLGLFRFAGWFHLRSETALWPRASASELDCTPAKVKLSADKTLKLVIEDERSFEDYLHWLREPKAKYGLPDLHLTALPEGDRELRVWLLPAFYPASVFTLKRTQGQWSDLLFHPDGEKGAQLRIENHPLLLGEGDRLWNKLAEEGILNLPDGYCLKDYYGVLDGVGFMVEINLNGAYRIYRYSNPEFQHELPEPKQMVKITCLVFPGYCEETKK